MGCDDLLITDIFVGGMLPVRVFVRAADCSQLMDGQPVAAVPARFDYNRRLVAALCGTMMLNLVRQGGPAGAI